VTRTLELFELGISDYLKEQPSLNTQKILLGKTSVTGKDKVFCFAKPMGYLSNFGTIRELTQEWLCAYLFKSSATSCCFSNSRTYKLRARSARSSRSSRSSSTSEVFSDSL
jgi:hypothetical protein